MYLTPDIIEAAYRYLAATPPFKGWRMPHADEVEFHVIRVTDRRGDWNCWVKEKGGGHIIRISSKLIGRTQSLIEAVAHEMVHIRCDKLGEHQKAHHGAVFNRCAAQVCKHHGFDPKLF